MKSPIKLLSVLVLLPLSVLAQELDPDYHIKTAGSAYHRLKIDVDGNTYVYGAFDDFNGENVGRLLKLDEDGNLAAGFHPIYADNAIYDVLPLSDGKTLISGDFTTINDQAVSAIVRLNVDGTIDETFSCSLSSYGDMEMQSTGKIVVHLFHESRFVRLNADGSIDETFAFANYASAYRGFRIGPDNSIYFPVFSSVYRLTPDGADDNSFVASASNNASIYTVTVQFDGKVLVAGSFTGFNGVPAKSLVRLNSDGSLDNSFSVGNNINGGVYQILERSTGNILIGGQFQQFGSEFTSLVELNPDGTLFKKIASVSINNIESICEDPSQKITIGGEFKNVNGYEVYGTCRFNADYSFDQLFQPVITYNNPNLLSVAVDDNMHATLAGDFKQLLGRFENGVVVRGTLFKFDETGQPDHNFAPNFPFANVLGHSIQSDGKNLVSGAFGNNVWETLRLNDDGSVDNTFNLGGGPTGGLNGVLYCIQQIDDLIYLGGSFKNFNGIPSESLVAVDFDGAVVKTFHGLPVNSMAHRVARQSDGKFIVSGSFYGANFSDPKYLVRFNADGSIDNSFNPPIRGGSIGTIAVDAYDNIYVGGTPLQHKTNFQSLGCLLKLTPDGEIDETFDMRSALGSFPMVYSLIILPDGRIAVGGIFDELHGLEEPGFTILNTDGSRSLSTPFFGKGSVTFDMFLKNGELFLAGSFKRRDYTQTFSLVKLHLGAAIPPPAPSNLDVALTSPGVVKVSWSASASDQQAFIVERAINNLKTFVRLDTVETGVNEYTDVIERKDFHAYRVRAISDVGYSSAYSNVDSLLWAPVVEGTLTLDVSPPGSADVTLSWQGPVIYHDGFIVKYKTATNATFVVLDTVAANIASFLHAIDREIEYQYQVIAYNQKGSISSQLVSIMWQPVPEGTLMLDMPAPSSATLTFSWQGTVVHHDGFIIERKTGISGSFVALDTVAANIKTFTDLIGRHVEYHYRIRAYNQRGSIYSESSFAKWEPVPHGSLILNASTPTEPNVTLTWTGSVLYHDGFIVELKHSNNSGYTALDTLPVNSVSFTHPIVRNAKYNFRVRAFNVTGFVSSEDVSVEWLPIPKGDLMLELTASAGEATLSWPGTTLYHDGFIVHRSSDLNVGYEQLASIGPGETTFTDITDGRRAYHYKIVAYNANGTIVSNEVSTLITSAEHNAENGIQLFPNPASEYAIVSHSPGDVSNVHVVDRSGKILYPLVERRADEFAIDLHNLSPGVFVIRMTVDGKNLSRRFVKK